MKRYIYNTKQLAPNISPARMNLLELFLVILGFFFIIQQFQSTATFTNSPSYKNVSSALNNLTNADQFHFSSMPSSESFPSTMEMEVAEDDDRQNYEEGCNNNLNQQYFRKHLLFNNILRSRYLQLTSSVQQQPAVPFFILHHSWKNHIG
jgi:hypothetical protein